MEPLATAELSISSVDQPGNYKEVRENPKTNRTNNKGWQRVGNKAWIGVFGAARAHRLPPGVHWREVQSRVTEDSSTGEVIEKIDLDSVPFEPAAADRRLDRVRDIVTRIELRTEAPLRQPGTEKAETYTQSAKKLIWADAEFEDE